MSGLIRLCDLTSSEIRMLIRLEDGQPHEDSVGLELENLNVDDIKVCAELVKLGLVETHAGWGGSFWFRLSETGRRVRESGEA